jgi:hypothetical protein
MSFLLSETNPNDTCGGSGCLCGETKNPDSRGPYVVVPELETESNISPFVVICAGCLPQINAAFEGEALAAGEKSEQVLDAEFEELLEEVGLDDI